MSKSNLNCVFGSISVEVNMPACLPTDFTVWETVSSFAQLIPVPGSTTSIGWENPALVIWMVVIMLAAVTVLTGITTTVIFRVALAAVVWAVVGTFVVTVVATVVTVVGATVGATVVATGVAAVVGTGVATRTGSVVGTVVGTVVAGAVVCAGCVQPLIATRATSSTKKPINHFIMSKE